MFCPECGKEIAAGVSFCTNCGNKMEGSISTIVSATADKHNRFALIGGILLVISFFLPWVSSLIGSMSGFEFMKSLYRMASGTEKLMTLIVWLIPIGGALTAYFAYTRNDKTVWTAIITVAISIIIWIFLLTQLKGDLFKGMGIGLYLMLAGTVCLGISTKRLFANILKL